MAAWNEYHLEQEICNHLRQNGWLHSPNDSGFDPSTGTFPQDLYSWLEETQPDAWEKVVRPSDPPIKQEKQRQALLERVYSKMSNPPAQHGGTLNALKYGVKHLNAQFTLFQSKPPSSRNPKTTERYTRNRLRVMQQVHYSQRNRNSIDLVLFLNGLPVATIELKTDMTQDVEAALRQYAQDRKPQGESLLISGPGALVHFAVSNQLVYMTTKLQGAQTYFLPFNRGHNNGAGNPPIEGTSPTAYFWQETLDRDSWLDLISQFLHYRHEEKTNQQGQRTTSSTIRFPRYHQHRVVKRLEEAVKENGPGTNYLIQHSAGSGKTDSIAWTAHRMSQLHDENDEAVFQTVLVISDRTVLDGQLQTAVDQLADVGGVFAPVTKEGGGSKSLQLAIALARGAKIIGVTLQTFPYAVEEMNKRSAVTGKKYAVIADEAHSSQTGSAAKKLKEVLGAAEEPEASQHGAVEGFDQDGEPLDVTVEDTLLQTMSARANTHGNITFFAFTATPKAKTVELFGTVDPTTGNKVPFDVYPMKQAIEEKFIKDVLQNYITYDLAFKLSTVGSAAGTIEVEKKKANQEIMRWLREHPHNIESKASIIVDHFAAVVAKELGGEAKAMVVTSSRKEAARFKVAIDTAIADRGLPYHALVAFSGNLDDVEILPERFTEADLNKGTVTSDIPTELNSDRFNLLVVADKFQTGFDQPKLVAMYLDKKVGDIAAVQTLSRLNRVMPGKERTYVLDFVNKPHDILDAFRKYYEDAELIEEPDFNVVFDCLDKIKAQHIIDPQDVRVVVEQVLSGKGNNKTFSALKPAVDVWKDRYSRAVESGNSLEVETLEDFCSTITAFIRAYDFYSQVLDYQDTEVEQMSIYLRLLTRLIGPERQNTKALDLESVTLTHYKLGRHEHGSLGLSSNDGEGLSGLPNAIGSAKPTDVEKILLEQLLEQINDLFSGSGLEDEHQLNAVSSIYRLSVKAQEMQSIAVNNSPIDFAQSPKLGELLDEIRYDVDVNTSKALGWLSGPDSLNGLLKVLLRLGLYEDLRKEAELAS